MGPGLEGMLEVGLQRWVSPLSQTKSKWRQALKSDEITVQQAQRYWWKSECLLVKLNFQLSQWMSFLSSEMGNCHWGWSWTTNAKMWVLYFGTGQCLILPISRLVNRKLEQMRSMSVVENICICVNSITLFNVSGSQILIMATYFQQCNWF